MNNNDVVKAAQEYIGNLIRLGRKKKGLTQEQLADMVDVSTMSIRRYENGDRSTPDEVMKRISDVLGDIFDDNSVVSFKEWMSREKEVDSILAELEAHKNDPRDIDLLAAYRKLNMAGQRIAIERVEELTQIPKYQRKNAIEQATPITDTPATEKPPEGQNNPADGK